MFKTPQFFFISFPNNFLNIPPPAAGAGGAFFLALDIGGKVFESFIIGWPRILSSTSHPHFVGFDSPFLRARPRTLPARSSLAQSGLPVHGWVGWKWRGNTGMLAPCGGPWAAARGCPHSFQKSPWLFGLGWRSRVFAVVDLPTGTGRIWLRLCHMS